MARERWGGQCRDPCTSTLRKHRFQRVRSGSPLISLFNLTFVLRFHCEGRIVCTLFGLLFWDVLFADIPGAFETPYQSAPLDIAEDCFYYAREELIKERLAEIEQGKARQILENVDKEHRAKGTLCVGVRWDLFTRQDLLEIVDVSNAIHFSDPTHSIF